MVVCAGLYKCAHAVVWLAHVGVEALGDVCALADVVTARGSMADAIDEVPLGLERSS